MLVDQAVVVFQDEGFIGSAREDLAREAAWWDRGRVEWGRGGRGGVFAKGEFDWGGGFRGHVGWGVSRMGCCGKGIWLCRFLFLGLVQFVSVRLSFYQCSGSVYLVSGRCALCLQ